MSHAGISSFLKSARSGKSTFGAKLRRIICWTSPGFESIGRALAFCLASVSSRCHYAFLSCKPFFIIVVAKLATTSSTSCSPEQRILTTEGWTCVLLSQPATWTWGTRKFSYPWITASMPLQSVATRSNVRTASERDGVATRGRRVRRRDSSSLPSASLVRGRRDAPSLACVPLDTYMSRSIAAVLRQGGRQRARAWRLSRVEPPPDTGWDDPASAWEEEEEEEEEEEKWRRRNRNRRCGSQVTGAISDYHC